MSFRKILYKIKKKFISGIAQAKLIVPYTVLQELDKLKHRRSDDLASVASKVIRFLNEKFSNSEDWIQGQSPVTANNNKLIEIENPDDNILNCCLQLKQQTDKILLLSNDVNLRNKALFSAVLAYSKDQFEYEADNLHTKFL
jgi:predicted ribonuclease YlaK